MTRWFGAVLPQRLELITIAPDPRSRPRLSWTGTAAANEHGADHGYHLEAAGS